MRYLSLLIAAAPLFFLGAATAAEQGPRVLAGVFNATTPEGWRGKRYMEANQVFAEEFDSNGDGRMDVWRFYRRGMLSSEERDMNGDGRVDFQGRWNPDERRLIRIFRDSDFTGSNDLEIEAQSARRWEIREDRNSDGITDLILVVEGPPDMFEALGIDLYRQRDIAAAIPRQHWYELSSDNGFSGYLTEYYRFARGRVSQSGEWDGTKVVWRRAPANMAQPDLAAAPSAVVLPPAAVVPAGGQPPLDAGAYVAPSVPAAPAAPFDDVFPQPDVFAQPDVYPEPGVYQAPVYTPPAAPSDRTRYDGLPPGESAARSLPARMRPPGVGRRAQSN